MSTAMAPMGAHIHQIAPAAQPFPQPPQQDYARMVAGQFVQQYYHVLKSYSKHLHRFYMEDSSFTISGKEGMAESKTAKGQAIQTILTDHLPEAQADCQSFEAQLVCVPGMAAQDPFYNGTPILIQAAGALLASGKSYTFTQTFFLAPFGGANRGPGYYVANDILRLTPTDGRPALENGFAAVAAPLALDAVADKPAEVLPAPNARRSVTPPPAPAAAPAVPQPEPAAPPAAPKAAPAPVQPKTPAPVLEKPAPPSPASVAAAAASAAATAATAPAAPAPSSPPRVAPPTAKPADTPPTTTTTTPAPPSPSPAINPNLNWAERVKLSTAAKTAPPAKAATTAATAATAAITPPPAPKPAPAPAVPSPAPTAPAPTPTPPPTQDTAPPAAPASPTKVQEASSNGAPAAPAHDEPPTNSVMVQDLPESTPQQVLDLLAPFGPVKGGVDAISLKPYKERWTAYLDFETRDALDAAVAAELFVGELRVKVVERKPVHGKGSRGRGGGARFGAGRGGERRADSFGRRPLPAAGLANGGPADRPPRSGRGGFHSGEGRSEGVEGDRTRPEGGRGEGRGRRGSRGSGRGRGRNADGARAASPGPATAPAAAGEA